MSSEGVPDYPYGDGKSGESANFGPFKNNWYAITLYCSEMSVFDGLDMNDYNSGRVLNEEGNLAAAIQCQHRQMSGADASGRQNGFWAVQRNGETVGGCNGDAVGDTYKEGVDQIIAYLNEQTGSGTHLDDNTVVNPLTQAC